MVDPTCGHLTQNEGYAVILIDGTLEPSIGDFDSVQRFSLKIPGQPTCLLQLTENRFLWEPITDNCSLSVDRDITHGMGAPMEAETGGPRPKFQPGFARRSIPRSYLGTRF